MRSVYNRCELYICDALMPIVLPSPPVIDKGGDVVVGYVGPYLEGDRLVLTCKTFGGTYVSC